jgi:predicted RNase H-like HicB family nuclease
VTEYLVVYEQSQDGWGAYAPDLPGLGVVGDTFEEAQQLITDGITFHLEALKEHGDPVPRPAARSAYIPVAEGIA